MLEEDAALVGNFRRKALTTTLPGFLATGAFDTTGFDERVEGGFEEEEVAPFDVMIRGG